MFPLPYAPTPDYHLKPPPVLYHPTAVGTTWVYEDGGREWTEVVTKVVDRSGAKVVSVGREAKGAVGPWVEVEVSGRGLFRVSCQGLRDDPPQPWLRLPLGAGVEWEYNYFPGRPAAGKVRSAAFEAEEVKVPAGTFMAVRVEISRPGGLGTGGGPGLEGLRSRSTRWFAPGVGMVKAGGGTWGQVLKSYTPGKG